jgi:hypothetical protein
MNYKETLFFIGKCLTISHENHNNVLVEEELKSNNIDWDTVVKVSTSHYVFPALYCNLKRADFLHYLPTDLLEYMKYITDLNRERNQQIIDQAKEINELLLTNNITPIFLKGTGNLLEGLYEDIGERMVGDIDFLVSKNDFIITVNLLKKNGYNKYSSEGLMPPNHRHYMRLIKENNIGAIEIHKELLIEKYVEEFNYDIVKEDVILINDVTVMSFDNQLTLSIIAKQINDDGFYFKNISLRNAYDVFLLSKKIIVKNTFNHFNNLFNPLNCFISTCYEIFGQVDSLEYTRTTETKSYLSFFNKSLSNDLFRKKNEIKIAKSLIIRKSLKIIYKSIFNKEYRNWLISMVTDKKWLKQKLVQLGLKKPKSNSQLHQN